MELRNYQKKALEKALCWFEEETTYPSDCICLLAQERPLFLLHLSNSYIFTIQVNDF